MQARWPLPNGFQALTGRFASALSVRDFVRRMPVVSLSRRDAESLSRPAQVWARIEGLPAHGEAARLRGAGEAP